MSNSSIMKRNSVFSDVSDNQMVHDFYQRSKTENFPNFNNQTPTNNGFLNNKILKIM